MQSRPACKLAHNVSMSGASGKQPLMPITAIGSGRSEPAAICAPGITSGRRLRRRPSELIGSPPSAERFACMPWWAFCCGAGVTANAGAKTSPCSRTRYAVNAAIVGASKNTVGLSVSPYRWFNTLPNDVSVIESNPNSLSGASRSKRSRAIFRCVAIKPVSARSNCPPKASPEGVISVSARISSPLSVCTGTALNCVDTAFAS
ncbi:hypothetical protein BOTU111921_29345 [Bordetella tumbae]